MATVTTYNPKKVTCALGRHIASGFADDSFINIEPAGDGTLMLLVLMVKSPEVLTRQRCTPLSWLFCRLPRQTPTYRRCMTRTSLMEAGHSR